MERKTTVLLILDGWGHRDATEHNAIAQAKTPCWDGLWQNHPHTLLDASGHAVGLPNKQMGNSEVGHLNMGAGRQVLQDLSRIQSAIDTGAFNENPALVNALHAAVKHDRAVHLMGLLSPGGVHAHQDHWLAMIALAAKLGVTRLYCHAFLDGRDTPPQSAQASLEKIQQQCADLNVGRIASLCGRFYAMDRDNRWERIEKAYNLLVSSHAEFHTDDAMAGLQLAYARDETDEFVQPTLIADPAPIADNDLTVFMNFRADRARQLTKALCNKDFDGFIRKQQAQPNMITLTEYEADLPCTVAFPPTALHNTLPAYLASLGKTQCHAAETEKYAHVTFFFNGGSETILPGEERILVNSPNVHTYDEQPEMSVHKLTDNLVKAIQSQQYDFIVCNFANADMVGHTGNFEATKTAIEAIDTALSKILKTVTETQAQWFITADHGNAELMFNHEHGQPHTAHTNHLVPFVYVGKAKAQFTAQGTLCDIAPTLLYAMQLPLPEEMTGECLLNITG